MAFSIDERNQWLDNIKNEHFELIIIGGGITGAGVFLDAVSRGMKCLLLEKTDFASGTSSKSTKLIHGGLRYLKQREFSLVAEVGKERSLVQKNAPHLVVPIKVLVPSYKGGNYGRLALRAAMALYERLVKVPAKYKHKNANTEGTLESEPLLNPEDLRGSVKYTEFRTDDARLTFEIIKRGVELGGKAINYCQVEDFIFSEGKILGVKVRDRLSNISDQITADFVVNAAGPWVDQITSNTTSKNKKLLLTKGIHLVFKHEKIPVQSAIYFDAPDGRMIFAVPREGCTYIGTTDTFFDQHPDAVTVKKEDVKYLLECINQKFPSCLIATHDIISSWAGLRPLIAEKGKKPGEISRKDELFVDENGLITIAGGKLTGYRKMAIKTVDKIANIAADNGKSISESTTANTSLSGGKFDSVEASKSYLSQLIHRFTVEFTASEIEEIFYRFGSLSKAILKKAVELNYEGHANPIVISQLRYCLKHECLTNAFDFYFRRTSMAYFNPELMKATKGAVLVEMQEFFQWSESHYENQLEELEKSIISLTNFD